MNKLSLFVSVVALGAFLGAGCQSNVGANLNNGNATSAAAGDQGTAKGKVIFSITDTDAAASMQGVTAVQMTIDKIEMHSATKGWVNVSNDTKTFDLLTLKASGLTKLAAETNVAVGAYNQIRVHVKKIVVVKNGVSTEAKLPSNELKLNGIFNVNADAVTSVKLDIIVSQSLHITGKGKFIFAPVIKLESRSNATVQVGSDGFVSISGGKVNTNIMAGMDIKGEEKENFKLDADSNMEINDEGVIELKSGLKVKVGAQD
ncbi:MAG: DUF4382 domain-containing protein, partial [Candidatus Uhrbacteria bacterium]|nr:DUF4382 domain-containing protein [Candidatus Uhrbacteria bacterium]